MITIKSNTDIPGWSRFTHLHKWLFDLLPENANILEIGVGFGKSTWYFLDLVKPDMTVSILDSFANLTPQLWQHAIAVGLKTTLNEKNIKRFSKLTRVYSQREMFIHCISQHKNFKNIKQIYEMTSEDYINKKLPCTYDLVFIDGLHTYSAVKKELDYFKNSKIIAGDDYKNEDWPGVEQAVADFMRENPSKQLFYDESEPIFVICNRADNFVFYCN